MVVVPRWWQSPSLQYGSAYQSVTLTINLRQLYQVCGAREYTPFSSLNRISKKIIRKFSYTDGIEQKSGITRID
jgi:hypothetical protein